MPSPEERSSTMISSIFLCSTVLRDTTPDPHHDFISFLAVAQHLNIDFLPIRWQPALDLLGVGGTAEVRQSFINLQTSLAFKCICLSEEYQFRALISEISILGHPAVRNHANIITLEGICWDIPVDDEIVRPVLVFEKTEYGNMIHFLNSGLGKSMDFQEKLRLCVDVANALTVMHLHNIIYGDIKPQNVLVFKEISGSYIAKVVDFGYSCQYTSEADLIKLPLSKPWNAPEWHHRAFRPSDATKMDLYSFGMLCLWFLFQGNKLYPDQNSLEEFKSKDTLRVLAQQLIISTIGLNDEVKSGLDRFFNLTLARDPKERGSGFGQLLTLIANRTTSLPLVEPVEEGPSLSHVKFFQVLPAMRQLYMADSRVRSHIAMCLKVRAIGSPSTLCCDICSREAAFQLALCYKVGFGVPRNDKESQTMLDLGKRSHRELEYEVFKLQQLRHGILVLAFRDGNFKKLFRQGHISTLNFTQYNHDHRQSEKMELEYRREINDLESVLGDDSVLVCSLKSTLANILSSQGFWKKSEELHMQVFEIRKDVLGLRHADTMTSMANLAFMYRHQGLWKEAEKLFLEVLRISLNAVGAEHPDTLTSMENLATTFSDQGRWKEAQKLYLRIIETKKAVFGGEHPGTLNVMASLATTFVAQGMLEKAEAVFLEVIDTSKKVLGIEHQVTLMSMANLASAYRDKRLLVEAEDLLSQVIEIRKRVLGPEHPITLSSMIHLASTYLAQRSWGKAEQLLLTVIDKSKKVLGAEHPQTMSSVANLAVSYRKQGRLVEAEMLNKQIVEAKMKVMGTEHPSTLSSMTNLASTWSAQCRWKDAEELYMQVIKIRKRLLGTEHRATLASMANLAATYKSQERWKEAQELYEQVIDTAKRALGADHPVTQKSMASLASMSSNMKDATD